MSIEYLVEVIVNAFKGVKLEQGIGLWEAQAIDDYETKECQLIARSKDEKEDWQLIKSNDIFLCDSSLSYMDAKGIRFHVPAFIVAEINGKTNIGPFYTLTERPISDPELFRLFSSDQKLAVASYLEYCALQEEWKFDLEVIKKVLSQFWYKN